MLCSLPNLPPFPAGVGKRKITIKKLAIEIRNTLNFLKINEARNRETAKAKYPARE